MKKLLSFILVLGLVLFLTACDGISLLDNTSASSGFLSPDSEISSVVESLTDETDSLMELSSPVKAGIVIEYDSNLFMNIYDIRLSLDGSALGVQTQGTKELYELDLEEGTHELVFSEFGNDANTKTIEIEILEDEYYYFFIKTRESGIEIEGEDTMTLDEVQYLLEGAEESESTESEGTSVQYIYEGPSYEIVEVQEDFSIVGDFYWVLVEPFDYSTDAYRDQMKAIITDVAYKAGTSEFEVSIVTDEDIIEVETNYIAREEHGEDWYISALAKEEANWILWYTGGLDLDTGELSSEDSAYCIDWFIASNTEHESELWKPEIEF